MTDDHARLLLDLIPGERVLVRERPLSYVCSPEKPFGVDCLLGVAGSARQVRGIGTVVHRAAITGGHVLQGSAYATVVAGRGSARQPWSHYLSRPGVLEVVGRIRWPELADSLALTGSADVAPDFGAIAGRAADEVQRLAVQNLRYQGPLRLRAARVRLRWLAQVDPDHSGSPEVGYTVYRDGARLLRLIVGPAVVGGLVSVAEDVALHDWLLTTLLEITRRAAIGVKTREETIERLIPAIDYLLHLWMPGARGDDLSDQLWAVLERRPGFSRQWDTLVNRIRDQLSVAALANALPH